MIKKLSILYKIDEIFLKAAREKILSKASGEIVAEICEKNYTKPAHIETITKKSRSEIKG